MSKDEIKCPKCGTQISIDEAIVQKMVNLKVGKELSDAKIEIEKSLREEKGNDLKILENKLILEKEKREKAEKKELEILKKQTELEERVKRQDLEVARKVAEERKTIEEKIRKEEHEKQDFKYHELQKQLNDTKKALTEAQRKSQQGSMQTQGEVLELELEKLLKLSFLTDLIEPVGKGITGADIIQKIIHRSRQQAGIIVWETKRTKGWDDKWIEKLKEDSRNMKASACILVSDNLPKEINGAGLHHGVWVCNFSFAISVATLLRHGILEVFNTVLVNTGKDEKKEAIYDYLCSPTFRQKVDLIVENSAKMLEIVEMEKKWMTKKWASEEVRIRRLQDCALKLWGDISGIAGSSLPEPNSLVLNLPELKKKEYKKKTDQTNLF